MTAELVRSLAIALSERFEGYEVYTEGVYMGAEKPCFFIECEKAEKIPLLGKRFILRISLSVTLESDSDTKRLEAEEAVEKIFDAMSLLEADGRKIRGRALNGREENGGFVMRGVYDVFLCAPEEEEKVMMETLTVKGERC